MTVAPDVTLASPNRSAELRNLISTFAEALSEESLTRLYRSCGRIWLDSGDFELRLSFGPSRDSSAHAYMQDEPSAGQWVYAGLEIETHRDHPRAEDGVPTDWAPDAAWSRDWLLSASDDIANDLIRAAEIADAHDVCSTIELDAECIEKLTLQDVTLLVSEFIAKLSTDQLARIYWSGARLWMDTGDGDMRISFGPPRNSGAHPNMDEEELTVGHWVWFGLDYDTAEDHPLDEDGYRADDWPEVASWMRDDLEYSVSWIAQMLQEAAEQAEVLS